MAQGILGNALTDHNITIPVEDFAEYHQLLKARQIIVDKIETDKNISVFDTLSALGGAKACRLLKEYKEELGVDEVE